VENDFIFPFNIQTMHIKYVILYTTEQCFPKNLIPWPDLNPGLLVPELDAMSTAPRIFMSDLNFQKWGGGHCLCFSLQITQAFDIKSI
jgi:hypothetical protein